MEEIREQIPFMDLHPELKLVPTTCVQVKVWNFRSRFDYVQDFNRKSADGHVEKFHLLVKDGKYGILLHSTIFFGTTDEVALPAEYTSIEFIYKVDKSFGVIVSKEEKYGLYFWEHGSFMNKKFSVPTEYDKIEQIDNKRIKGTKDNIVVYFDITGHILK